MGRIEVRISEIFEEEGCKELCCRIVLEASDGSAAFPVVISVYDAKPLIAAFEDRTSVRPQTHDLICKLLHSVSLTLSEVFISRFERGVFYSCLIFTKDCERLEIDSRTSDALVLALKCGVPVYVDESVLKQVSRLTVTLAESSDSPIRILEREMEYLVELERYEEAAVVRDRIRLLRERPGSFLTGRTDIYES